MNYSLIVVRHFFHGFITLLRHTLRACVDGNRAVGLPGAPPGQEKLPEHKNVCRYTLHYWKSNTRVAVIGQLSEI